MHECPDCGQACTCDIEDIWHDEAPYDCSHECDDYDDLDPDDIYGPE